MTAQERRQRASELKERLLGKFASVRELASVLRLARRDCLGDGDGEQEGKQAFLRKFLPGIQQVLLSIILIDWQPQLVEDNLFHEFEEWILPLEFQQATKVAVATSSLLIIGRMLSMRSGNNGGLPTEKDDKGMHKSTAIYICSVLPSLFDTANLKSSFEVIFPSQQAAPTLSQRSEWDDYVKLIFALPIKIANSKPTALKGVKISQHLEWNERLVRMSQGYARLITSLSGTSFHFEYNHVLSATLAKFISVGCFSGSTSSQQHIFWPTIIQEVLTTIANGLVVEQLRSNWRRIIDLLPLSQASTVFSSLVTTLLAKVLPEISTTPYLNDSQTATRVNGSAEVIDFFFGPIALKSNDKVSKNDLPLACVARILINAQWTHVGSARLLFKWFTLDEAFREDGLCWLLETVLSSWQDKVSIEQADAKHREYLTFLLMLCVKSLPPQSAVIKSAASSPAFIHSIQAHLGTMRQPVRHLGMLVAECMSEASLDPNGAVKPLSFGNEIWDSASGDAWRQIRDFLLESRNVATSGFSLLSLKDCFEQNVQDNVILPPRPVPTIPKPTPKKATAPIKARPKIQVLSALGDSDSEGDLEPYNMPEEEVDPDLNFEDLSTFTPAKKKAKVPVYITDLAAYLRSNEDAEKVEIGLATAESLIRRKSGWGNELVEHSVDLAFALISMHDNFDLPGFEEQRENAMTALISGSPATVAPTIIEQYFLQHYAMTQKISMLNALAKAARELSGCDHQTKQFPSKQLPDKPHKKLMGQNEQAGEVQNLAALLAASAMEDARAGAQGRLPEAARNAALTTRRSANLATAAPQTTENRYLTLSQQFFVMPLVNRMWRLLEDAPHFAQGRPLFSDLRHHPLFGPVLLSNYFHTLCVLVDLGRHASGFLGSMAPEILQLVLATTGLSQDSEVVTAQARLLLVTINASSKVDNGRSMMRNNRETVYSVKDWAESVWNAAIDRGVAPGPAEQTLAGLLLSLDEITP